MSVQCSTDVGFYQVRLPPPSTSQFLRQIDSDHPWSEASRRIIKSCWFHADFQMDLLLPGILARLPKSWGFSCQTFAILAGHIFCHLVAYFKSFKLYISGNGSMERCGYQRWHWGFKTAPASQGFNKVMTVDTMGRSPNFSIAGWSRANLLATPRHSVMFFLEKSTWIRFI